ncbi:uncharacterized protein N7515_006020 [Penicillium bovifimosum]|uniref:Uncharacterized protein n=1 Tax=Penicillium bovifimosum TaxID=126998 RepID=A0A9W9L0D4_9EURO|nr:uncharacterized protein N7515_006020 [Penicillium bovifimosum]KAJ5129981.1 hypothetical protein N7515_006020 [Penicillium bovifimosum]
MLPSNPNDTPPAYTPSPEYTSNEKPQSTLLLTPESTKPGLATSSSLLRGLQVPSRSRACTSGFDYPDELAHYNISPEQWSQFTQVVCDEAKLSRQQWSTVIGKSLGTMAVGGLMVGLLGAIPAIFIGRLAKSREEQRNLIYALAGAGGEALARHISGWNERGVLIRVDLPDEDLEDLEGMDVWGGRKGREKAKRKARIVIIPLDGSSDL